MQRRGPREGGHESQVCGTRPLPTPHHHTTTGRPAYHASFYQVHHVFSRQKVRVCCHCARTFSLCQLFVTPWTVAHQTPLSVGFSRGEYWGGLSFPPLGDLPNPGIELMSPVFPTLQVDSLPLGHWGSPCCQ